MLSSYISSTCPHNMANFGPLAAEIVSLVWGTPANFNGFRVLTALLHGTLVVGVSQTLRRCTEGATCIRQSSHHVGHWPTFWLGIHCRYYISRFCSVTWYRTMVRAGSTNCMKIICQILECGSMPNVMVALQNIGGALCSTPQSLADAQY